MLEISTEKLQKMFEHYIERKRYNQNHNSCSQDAIWSGGECEEAKRWLTLFGVDLSYERIQSMIDGKQEVKVFD